MFRNGELVEEDLFISEGKISAIERSITNSASKTINASGLILLPGLIDPHVHFRDPGQTYKEDFLSGTRGAVAGGTTTVFDMPNTEPAVTTPEFLQDKANSVKSRAVCNYCLIAGASHHNLTSIPKLKEAGAIAFKTFMVAPPKEREEEYAGLYVTNSGELMETMEAVKDTGLVHCIHAECNSTIEVLTSKLRKEGRKDALAHYDSRPNFTEQEALADALVLAHALETRVHIVHVSTSQSVYLLIEAKKKGINVSSETCPQYMLFTNDILKRKGPYGKFNPPPRNTEDKERLISAVAGGEIDMISTDHAPHANAEKQQGFADIFKAPSGAPGVETRLPLLLQLVHQEKIAFANLPWLTSEAAAVRFGISPRKGALEVGSDADIAIVDFNQEWTVRSSELQTKAWETDLYDGMNVRGRVKYTLVNGEMAYEDGVGFASPGKGEFLQPNFVNPVARK